MSFKNIFLTVFVKEVEEKKFLPVSTTVFIEET